MTGEDHLAANRANWDERADIHIADETGFYDIAGLVAGRNPLTGIEREGIGDITGLKVAHFQCHIGTDTIGLKRLGAAAVTGLDFSARALGHARDLAARCGVEIDFVEGGVYDAPARIGGGFDLVFTSWGTIVWLRDVDAWARAVAGVLRPGGRLFFADGHPIAHLFEDGEPGAIRPGWDYATPRDAPIVFEDGLTYTGSKTRIASARTFEWNHSISRVLNALTGAGMAIERIGEHDALPWEMFKLLERGEDGMWRLPAGHVRFPLSWSIRATKRQ